MCLSLLFICIYILYSVLRICLCIFLCPSVSTVLCLCLLHPCLSIASVSIVYISLAVIFFYCILTLLFSQILSIYCVHLNKLCLSLPFEFIIIYLCLSVSMSILILRLSLSTVSIFLYCVYLSLLCLSLSTVSIFLHYLRAGRASDFSFEEGVASLRESSIAKDLLEHGR